MRPRLLRARERHERPGMARFCQTALKRDPGSAPKDKARGSVADPAVEIATLFSDHSVDAIDEGAASISVGMSFSIAATMTVSALLRWSRPVVRNLAMVLAEGTRCRR